MLAGLSPAHGEVIDLVYYHEKSVSEVAEILAIPEATVKTRMFYARKRFGRPRYGCMSRTPKRCRRRICSVRGQNGEFLGVEFAKMWLTGRPSGAG